MASDSTKLAKLEIAAAANDAVKLIASSVQDAAKLLASAAQDAVKVVDQDAANASKMLTISGANNSGDHDLIVVLGADMKTVKETLVTISMKEDTHATKQEFIDRNTLSDKIHIDHETRIRSIESSVTRILIWGSTILAILTIAQIVLKLVGK